MFATSEDAMDSLYVVDGFLVSTRCRAGCKSDIDGSSLAQPFGDLVGMNRVCLNSRSLRDYFGHRGRAAFHKPKHFLTTLRV
ncbi:hypothetical protein MRX96_045376 [Rhipicephalus microplus]